MSPGVTVRPARAAVAAGSFVYERTEGTDPPRRTVILVTRFADRTWIVIAPSEEQAAELLKKIVVAPGTDLPHLLLRGELPATLGIEPGLWQSLVHGPTADTLVRIEALLAAKPPVPFVVTAELAGNGLVVTTTLEGKPEALWELVSGDATSRWVKHMLDVIVIH